MYSNGKIRNFFMTGIGYLQIVLGSVLCAAFLPVYIATLIPAVISSFLVLHAIALCAFSLLAVVLFGMGWVIFNGVSRAGGVADFFERLFSKEAREGLAQIGKNFFGRFGLSGWKATLASVGVVVGLAVALRFLFLFVKYIYTKLIFTPVKIVYSIAERHILFAGRDNVFYCRYFLKHPEYYMRHLEDTEPAKKEQMKDFRKRHPENIFSTLERNAADRYDSRNVDFGKERLCITMK